jgi:WD40 repeat protein
MINIFVFLSSCTTFTPQIKVEGPDVEAEIKGETSLTGSLQISPEGRYVLYPSMGYFILWDILEGKQVLNSPYQIETILGIKVPGGAAFSPDGRYFAVGGKGQVSLWDLAKKEEIMSFDVETVRDIAFSHDGKYLLTVAPSPTQFFSNPHGIMTLFNIQTGRKVRNFETKPGELLTRVFFSRDGRYAFTISSNRKMSLWNVSTGKRIKEVVVAPLFTISACAAISPDGKYIVSATTNGKIILWDAKNLSEIREFDIDQSIWSVDFSPDGKYVLSGGRGKIIIWDILTGKEIKTIVHPSFASTMHSIMAKFSPDGKHIVSTAGDAVRIWDVSSMKEIATFIGFKDGEWIVITSSGYYHSSEKGDQYYKIKVAGQEYTVEQMREKFFRPDFVKIALAGKSLEGHKTLADVKKPPQVEIVNTPAQVEKDEIKVTVKLIDMGGGIGDVRLYLNETSILFDSGRAINIAPKSGEKEVYKNYTLKLLSGENTIKVVAFDMEGNVASKPAIHKVISTFKAYKRPSLYAVIIGINEYKNPKLELRYAVADAKLFAETLKDVATAIFEKVDIKLLTTKDDTTKDEIKRALEGFKSLNPDDVFVFYVASHGTVDEGEYFLITSNVGSLSTLRLKEDALSQTELKEMISNVPSTKKMIIIDTCSAGKLGEALQVAMLTRGLNEETAMKILSRAVGSTILSASTSHQEALEGYQGHGLFTYVLSEGMKGKADTDRDGFIRTLEIANYLDSEVPTLAERVFKRAQYPIVSPSGQSFPIGKVRY